jgi:hypothetical protein
MIHILTEQYPEIISLRDTTTKKPEKRCFQSELYKPVSKNVPWLKPNLTNIKPVCPSVHPTTPKFFPKSVRPFFQEKLLCHFNRAIFGLFFMMKKHDFLSFLGNTSESTGETFRVNLC